VWSRGKDGRWYSLRVRPYVTLDSKIDGASIVLVDIDAVRRPPKPADGPAASGS
jgi:two-component system CheB/CheR fusion protein